MHSTLSSMSFLLLNHHHHQQRLHFFFPSVLLLCSNLSYALSQTNLLFILIHTLARPHHTTIYIPSSSLLTPHNPYSLSTNHIGAVHVKYCNIAKSHISFCSLASFCFLHMHCKLKPTVINGSDSSDLECCKNWCVKIILLINHKYLYNFPLSSALCAFH